MVDPVHLHPITRPGVSRNTALPSAESRALNDVPAPPPNAQSAYVGLVDALAAQGPPIDQARVATLRAAIANGTYPLDATATAAAIVRFATRSQ